MYMYTGHKITNIMLRIVKVYGRYMMPQLDYRYGTLILPNIEASTDETLKEGPNLQDPLVRLQPMLRGQRLLLAGAAGPFVWGFRAQARAAYPD